MRLPLEKIVLNLFFLFALLFLVSGLFNRFNFFHPTEPESVAQKAEINFTRQGVLDQGTSLYDLLSSLGLSRDDVFKITQALGEVFNIKKCQPQDNFLLGFASDSTPLFLEYKKGFEKKFRVERKDSAWVATSLPVKFNRIVKYLDGEIRGSLWESMCDKCQNPELIANLTDIFAWQIDFLTEPRDGDRFRLVFEECWQDGQFVKYGDILTAEYLFSQSGDNYVAFLYEDSSGHKDYYDSLGHSFKKALLKSPLNYRHISSGFSYRRLHPIFRVYRPHLGVDYSAPMGTPVVAAGAGIVTFAGWKEGFGRYVEIRHVNSYITSYGHLSRYAVGIRNGAKVNQKDIVGYVGNSGHSTGPHLDYRVKIGGRYVNPLKVSLPPAAPIPSKYWDDFCENRDNLVSAMETLGQARSFASSSHE